MFLMKPDSSLLFYLKISFDQSLNKNYEIKY